MIATLSTTKLKKIKKIYQYDINYLNQPCQIQLPAVENNCSVSSRTDSVTCWRYNWNNCSGCWEQEDPDPDPNNLAKNDPNHKPDPDQSPNN